MNLINTINVSPKTQNEQAAIHRVLPQDIAPNNFAAFQENSDELNVARFEELNNLDVVSNPGEPMAIPSSPSRSAFRNIYGPGTSYVFICSFIQF